MSRGAVGWRVRFDRHDLRERRGNADDGCAATAARAGTVVRVLLAGNIVVGVTLPLGLAAVRIRRHVMAGVPAGAFTRRRLNATKAVHGTRAERAGFDPDDREPDREKDCGQTLRPVPAHSCEFRHPPGWRKVGGIPIGVWARRATESDRPLADADGMPHTPSRSTRFPSTPLDSPDDSPMDTGLIPPSETVVDRFLRYARIDTQSMEDQSTAPSTATQWTLAKLLADELQQLGAADVRVSNDCMVYASVPANISNGAAVPVLGLLAHVDTSPAVTGANVNPIIHRNYQGGDIVLPNDRDQVITVAQNPVLSEMIGDDIITTDGTTLLGSDDKAGIATIMTLVDLLIRNPQIKHGTIAVAFTSDEEIGIGIEKFDVAGFGADVAYTVDGGTLGEISDETWSARLATVTFRGKSTHPGTAKGVMVNAIYAFADYLAQMPQDMLPETTDGRVGFVHPYAGVADVEESVIKILLRDFEMSGLQAKEQFLRSLAAATERKFAGVTIAIDVKENYKNMKEVLRDHPQLTENAIEATRRAGLTPFMMPIRGGTDGSKLTFRGLPCPNIFTGGHNFHSKLEFNSRRGLEKTTETLVHLVQIFAENGAT
jgi:tripeptide aminopeptidase